MSESMIERVAKHFDPKAWTMQPKTPLEEKAIEHWKHVARLKARDAIEAMREPTDGMKAAMEPWTRVSGHQDGVWKAGIDAAMK